MICWDTSLSEQFPHLSTCHPEAYRNSSLGRQDAFSCRRISALGLTTVLAARQGGDSSPRASFLATMGSASVRLRMTWRNCAYFLSNVRGKTAQILLIVTCITGIALVRSSSVLPFREGRWAVALPEPCHPGALLGRVRHRAAARPLDRRKGGLGRQAQAVGYLPYRLSLQESLPFSYLPTNAGGPSAAAHWATGAALRLLRKAAIMRCGQAPRVITAWPVPGKW